MFKTVLLGVTAILATGSVVHLTCSGQSRQGLVDKDVHDSAGRAVSLGRGDHSTWDRLLRKYVDQDEMVAYAAWHASESDLRALQQYLDYDWSSNAQ